MQWHHETSMADASVAEPATPERLPFFWAEAMSPLMRWGVLAGATTAAMLVVFNVAALAIWPDGLFSLSPTLAVFSIGLTIAQGFLMMLVYGGLLSTNAGLTSAERGMWYAAFLFPGPFVMPLYWLMYVKDAPHREARMALPAREKARIRASFAPQLHPAR